MGLYYCTVHTLLPSFLVTAKMTAIWYFGFSIKSCLCRLVNPNIWWQNYIRLFSFTVW